MAISRPKITSLDKLAGAMPYLTALVVLLITASAYFLLLMPKIGDLMSGGKYDTKVAEARLDEAVAYKDKLTTLGKQYDKIDSAKLARLAAAIPAVVELPHFFTEFDRMAAASGFILTGIDAAAEAKDPSFPGRRSIKLSVGIKGQGYVNLKNFLANLETSARIYDVQSLGFTANAVDYSILMKTYYLDPDALLTVAAPPAAAPAP